MVRMSFSCQIDLRGGSVTRGAEDQGFSASAPIVSIGASALGVCPRAMLLRLHMLNAIRPRPLMKRSAWWR